MPQANNSANPIRRYNDGLGNTNPRNPDSTLTRAECRECGDVFAFADTFSFMCYSCTNWCTNCEQSPCECEEEENRIDIDERMYAGNDLEEFQSSASGKIITSKRVFSAEIEAYQKSQRRMNNTTEALSEHIGITSDGSLSYGGVEFQTPKLKGKNGEQAIKDLCKVLNGNQFTVNRETGLHIHLDGKGLLPRTLTTHEPVALKQLWQFYLAFDEVMLSFLPQSRRNNRYAKSMMKQNISYNRIAQAKTQRDIEVLWYHDSRVQSINYNKAHKYHDSRYHGINLHILLAEKHLEVRFHSGTLNATKILEWTAMHQRIADMATAHELITSESMLSLPLEAKTKMFFTILGLPKRAQKYFERRQVQFANKQVNVSLPPQLNTRDEESLLVDEVTA